MENLSMCRICLATDVQLCSIASHLRDMYERITAVTFNREDRRPLEACYICHARLQNCNRLRRSCLRSEELLTEMMNSGVLKPQDILSTNSFGVVSALHLSLGHALQDSTECQVKEAASVVISNAEVNQLYTEDIVTEGQEEECGLIDDNNQFSHVEDPRDMIKEEPDDDETVAEYLNFEDGDIKIEEIGWEPDTAGPSSQPADNICPKIVKVVLERTDVNNSQVDTLQPTEQQLLETTLTFNDYLIVEETPLAQSVSAQYLPPAPNSGSKKHLEVTSARVSENHKLALKDTEDATTQTETITIEKPKIVTKIIEVEKPVTTSKILETCDKIDINLNKCDDNVLTTVVKDVCEHKCTNDTSLKQNVSSISSRKNKPFICDTCNKCFSNKRVLRDHIRIHADKKLYQCNVCNKCFIRGDHLKRHIRTHTGKKPYGCNICKKRYNGKSDLNTHICTHSGEKPHQCNVCKKFFTREVHLKRHTLTHTGDKPYQCDVCELSFNRSDYLKRHYFTHTGEKPYQCNICKKCFIQKNLLNKHIRIHTGDKPYECNICKKRYNAKSELNNHHRTHTGDKPYECNICKKCFITKSVLQNHYRTHTSDKPYQCNVCKKCFSDSSSFSTHIRIHKR